MQQQRIAVKVPRDREGIYQPLIVGKCSRRFTDFDQKTIAMCARVMTERKIQDYLAEMYEVSPEFISKVPTR